MPENVGSSSTQMRPSRRLVLQGSAVGVVAGAGALAAVPPAAQAASAWTDCDASVGSVTVDPIVGVRTGVHATYERLVLDFAGSAAGGAWVGYSKAFWTMGTGAAYLVGGNAQLLLAVWGRSELGLGGGAVITRADQFAARGFTMFRDLVFGGTLPDQNWSAFGLGTAARRRFRVLQLGAGNDGRSRLVVDVLR